QRFIAGYQQMQDTLEQTALARLRHARSWHLITDGPSVTFVAPSRLIDAQGHSSGSQTLVVVFTTEVSARAFISTAKVAPGAAQAAALQQPVAYPVRKALSMVTKSLKHSRAGGLIVDPILTPSGADGLRISTAAFREVYQHALAADVIIPEGGTPEGGE